MLGQRATCQHSGATLRWWAEELRGARSVGCTWHYRVPVKLIFQHVPGELSRFGRPVLVFNRSRFIQRLFHSIKSHLLSINVHLSTCCVRCCVYIFVWACVLKVMSDYWDMIYNNLAEMFFFLLVVGSWKWTLFWRTQCCCTRYCIF